MATFIDQELYDHLDHLKNEVEKRRSESDSKSLQHLMHSQMKNLIELEKKYLEYVNPNETHPILSISPNGLPSLESLKPDLEAMCGLAEEEKEFKDIAERYKKGINGKNKGEKGNNYVLVSKEEWEKSLKDRKSEKLSSKIGFAVNETEDGKFELAVREDFYVKGLDKYSKEFPVLTREGNIRYHVVWNRLVEECEENFYVPSLPSVLKGKLPKHKHESFDDIIFNYKLHRSDFKLTRKPFLFLTKKALPKNYQPLISAWLETRVRVTENILDALSQILGEKIRIKDVKKEELWEYLDFKTEEKEIPCNNQTSIEFQLVNTTKKEEEVLGKIKYFYPYKEFTIMLEYSIRKGGIRLTLNGPAIENESHHIELQKKLKKRHIWGENGNIS